MASSACSSSARVGWARRSRKRSGPKTSELNLQEFGEARQVALVAGAQRLVVVDLITPAGAVARPAAADLGWGRVDVESSTFRDRRCSDRRVCVVAQGSQSCGQTSLTIMHNQSGLQPGLDKPASARKNMASAAEALQPAAPIRHRAPPRSGRGLPSRWGATRCAVRCCLCLRV